MKHPWLAAMVTSVAATAILLLCFGVGLRPSGHHHDTASVELAAAMAPGRGTTVPPPASTAVASTAVASTSAAVGSTTAGAPSGGHRGHGPGAAPTSVTSPAASPTGSAAAAPIRPTPASTSPVPAAGDPGTPAANRRQASLADAAGGALSAIGPAAAAAPPARRWVTPDAPRVNDGTKKQAAGLTLRPADRVDPTEILPEHGLANGCATGYGRGVACLPQTPPSHAGHGSDEDMSVYWTCAEARPLLPEGIAVDTPGADRLGLDSNGDGIACGPGDR